MPQYRKLYTKTVESLDVNDMPDDFTRLMWVLLPLGLCREGRGIDSPSWLRSKLFPLRADVTDAMIESAMDSFVGLGMIQRYQIKDRAYFCVCNWHQYQGKTDKEAETSYPPPPATPDLLPTYSRPTQAERASESEPSASHSAYESESESAYESTLERRKSKEPPVARGHRNDRALNIYMTEAGQGFPNEQTAKAVDETIGISADDLDFWQKAVHACILSGYRIDNVQCMLDHYGRRQLPGPKRGPPGNNGGQTAVEGMLALAEQHKRERMEVEHGNP